MKARVALAALACVLSFPALAAAAPASEPAFEPKRNAISYEPFAILNRGLVVQYERLVLPEISWVGGLGVRFGARDDFASQTWTLKTEARWWLQSKDRISGTRGMAGPYLAFGSVAARTTLERRRDDRSLGAYWQVEETLRFGHRFVVFGFQEITPSLGMSVVHEFDEAGRLAPNSRLTFGMNLSVGWMF